MHIGGQLRIVHGEASEAGRKPRNEDCLGIRIPAAGAIETRGIAAIIADGVSAAEAAKEASEICVEGFLNDYFSTPDSWQVKTAAHRVLVSLNRWLFGQGQSFVDERKGYLCAMSAMILKSRTAYVFHAGDTRVYRFRDGELEQLTKDHTTQVSRSTSYLARAMGMNLNLEIDYLATEAEEGDLYLMTTDGVHEYVARNGIKAALAESNGECDATCRRLINEALDNGSPDNVSCLIVRIESLPGADKREVYRELSKLPFPPDLEVGNVLDGWRVLRLMDASSRSQLYLVEDIDTRDRAVLKTPSVNFSDDPAYIERFIMEEWIGRRVTSPHLVRVLEKPRTPQFLYHVMEFVDGRSIADWIRDNPSPEIRTVVDIAEQVVKGLRQLHRRETLHQDLKPDNIIINRDGVAKIIDFGSAYVAGVGEIATPFERGTQLGTASHSAPEYRLGRRPTTRSDMFSLAVVVYEMLTGGKHPYGDRYEAAQTIRDFSNLEYTPASKHDPLIPGWIDGALKKALSIAPESRYEAFSEWLVDLRHPNPRFLDPSSLPLVQRNPVVLWQLISLTLLIALILLIVFR